MPELSLSLDLHLHHCVVSVLYALQGFLNSWKQINDFLFADQDLTVGRSQHGADVNMQCYGSFKVQNMWRLQTGGRQTFDEIIKKCELNLELSFSK